ncbi:stabilizer of axonemal microtubules 1, partial [Glossina fuscipes]|uniref:Stabilizer of axonemal microtubules 1 n=1 Tax=Glossina fuscipes TaxID=7396 RepID=A0A9C5ZDP8_9MUSC
IVQLYSVVCNGPEEGTHNQNNANVAYNPCDSTPQAGCGDYCPPRCDPCVAPADYTPCIQEAEQPCECRCDCGDYSGCCYQQPRRTLPILPQGCLMRSSAPMESDTIYRRSYIGNCGDGRSKPVLPCNHLATVKEPMEKCTIQKLSYRPHWCAARTQPIKPHENGLHFKGPLYAVSSQKHDFVPKGFCKREPIVPPTGICTPSSPLERCTVNRLSYMPIDVCTNPPPKPIVQTATYIRPTGPGEKCTVQKLSYLPICIPPKEPMPWAEQKRLCPPKYENLCTTYNLSYIPNCCPQRTAAILPNTGLKFLGTDRTDNHTVYKLSYVGSDARYTRPPAILPSNGLAMPTGPMENCTVQKLSYQPFCMVGRTTPIKPKENCIKPSGPLYCITTQKHDFVPKPVCRRAAIKPMSLICRPTGGMEKCTINRLSYLPVDVCEYRRPDAVVPKVGVERNAGPMEKCTTYKLSYLPICIQPKESLPWANQSNYEKPTGPIEKCTIQKLSYGPPGTFSRCGCKCFLYIYLTYTCKRGLAYLAFALNVCVRNRNIIHFE